LWRRPKVLLWQVQEVARDAVGGLTKLEVAHECLRLGERDAAGFAQEIEGVLRGKRIG
jgi:hypothetical protein